MHVLDARYVFCRLAKETALYHRFNAFPHLTGRYMCEYGLCCLSTKRGGSSQPSSHGASNEWDYYAVKLGLLSVSRNRLGEASQSTKASPEKGLANKRRCHYFARFQ